GVFVSTLFTALVLSRAFTLSGLMQRSKLGPLVRSQSPPHPEQNHCPRFVQFCTGDFDAPDLLHYGDIVTLFYQPFKLGFGLVECSLLAPQVRHRSLEDVLEPSALLGSQSKLFLVQVRLPPLEPLSCRGRGEEQQCGNQRGCPPEPVNGMHG